MVAKLRKFVFAGRVHPERIALEISSPIELIIGRKDENVEYKLVIFVQDSQINVSVETSDLNVDMDSLKNLVKAQVSSLIDIYGYLNGRWHEVEMTTALNIETNEMTVFTIEIPVIAGSKSERPCTYVELFGLGAQFNQLRRALASLRLAMALPDETGFFAYHAVEAIMNHFYSSAGMGSKKDAWKYMRDELNIDKDFIIEGIKSFANPQRHGDDIFISDQERAKFLMRTWKIVDRFCLYLKNKSQSLDKKQYPELVL